MWFWKRFSFVSFVLALIVTGGGYVTWRLLYPAEYKAQARLQVVAHAPRILFQTVGTDGKEDYKRYQQTQQALVKSQLALSAALRDNSVSKYRMIREQVDPIGWLQENLKVEFIADSEVMEISLSGDDPQELAGTVNAVKQAYIDEIINVDITVRAARCDQLKKLKAKYMELLRDRREAIRKLSERATSDDRLMVKGLARPELLSLHHGLWMRRIDLELERASAESRRAQLKKAAGPAIDPVRKETDQIEETLAGLTAQEKVIDEGLERLAGEIRQAADREQNLEEIKAEVDLIEVTYRRIGAEIEALNVELGAPPRIRTIEDAVPPLTRIPVTNWGF